MIQVVVFGTTRLLNEGGVEKMSEACVLLNLLDRQRRGLCVHWTVSYLEQNNFMVERETASGGTCSDRNNSRY